VETIRLKTVVGEDRNLTIVLPSNIPPGPVEVVVVINPQGAEKRTLTWTEIRGMGKEVWESIDVEKYINELRGEWPDEPTR